jgi:iron complex outermembrane recepter protein
MKLKIVFLFSIFLASELIRAQSKDNTMETLETITISASPIDRSTLSSPVKSLSSDELRNKLSLSLGETLSTELGLSASGFGTGASRPIVRGMEGSRVQILENGLGTGDVSSLSNDHALANGLSKTKSIEILRGSSALKYGSGSNNGIINIINDKILTELPTEMNGSLDSRWSSADRGHSNAFELNTMDGPLAFHFDGSKNIGNDYAIPGPRELAGWGPKGLNSVNSASSAQFNRLPFSYSFSDNIGAGLSVINPLGYTGFSVEHLNHQYGIPSLEGAQIKLKTDKLVVQHLSKNPMPGIESIQLSASSTHYQHQELGTDWIASTQFKNQGWDARIEVTHEKIDSWGGLFGISYATGQLSAFDLLNFQHAAILPPTQNSTWSLFWIEEKKWTSFTTDFGLRLERTQRLPDLNTPYTDSLTLGDASPPSGLSFNTPMLKAKSFQTLSWSTGLLIPLGEAHSTALHYALSQRAPAAEELFSYGAHDASATFDIGRSNLVPETSHQIELNFSRSKGDLKWKTNWFYSKIDQFIYGAMSGLQDTTTGFDIRQFNQADVTQKGLEAQLSWGHPLEGSTYRVFTDFVKTQYLNGQYTPLQAPVRLGLEWSYREGPLRSGLSAVHAFKQNHLAMGEIAPTPAYTDLRASWSYHQSFQNNDLDWYVLAKNLLNQDIRYSTTVQSLRLYAPQAGKSVSVGVKWNF